MAEENKLNNILEEQEKLSSVEYLIQKINGSGIKLNLSKEQMKEILEAGKEVQKMAVKYGTNQDIQIDDENTFNGYGTYVVSVNEDNARQLGIKIASRKYGGTFYINNQPFSDFLQEKSFSPYWTNLVSDFKDNSVDKLSHSILTSDVKGNPSLEREQIALSTLLNLDLIEYKREQTFLYSVNIPDNDNTNYLLYNNPIGIEHAQKINEHLEKLGTSWRVSRNDIGKNIYFNVLSNNVFNGNQKKSSEFLKNLGYVGMQMDNANYIVFNDKDMSITDRVQFMKDVNGEVYGFAYQGQIYADEELVNSNVLAHEYTHLWDKYVQDNNPELWQHGKDILKGTSLWQEITEDKNYENLKTDDEILSECHARVVGKMAEQVLERIEREDGGLTRDRVIDWDKEVSQYIAEELNIKPELGNENNISENIKAEYLKEFLSKPMKDLMNELQISKNWFEKTPAQLQKEQEREDIHTTQAAITVGTSYEEWEEMLDDNQKADEIIEKMQANGGLSEAAIEADIQAQENPRPDYIDSDGIPHWNDEEEINEPVDMAGYEFDEYIHSDEFIEKFGDWEKINRLEKLENQQIIQVDSTIIDNGKDITKEIRNLRNNPTKENVKKLRDIGQSIGAKFLNTPFENLDTNESMIFVNNTKIQETTSHHIKDAGVIESIYHLPELIKNGILIQETLNEDKEKHPEIEKYQYLINGFKVEDEEYTAKTVISIDKQGRKFYDQRLSSIEKGNLIDLLKRESDSKNFSRLTKSGEFETALYNYDTRLFRVCQIPQFNFLERNEVTGKWQPTMEAVNKIKTDTLVLTKDSEGIELLTDTETNITYGTNLSGFIKAIKESREKSKNIAYKNSNKSLEDKLDNLKQTLQEKDKELDIWTAKAEADNKTIQNLNKQLEQEKAYHTSSCVITVPQRDSKGNIKKDSHGNPLTITLNCSEGTYGALSKLSSKVVDLTFENKKLREQLNHQNNISQKSPSDDEWGR